MTMGNSDDENGEICLTENSLFSLYEFPKSIQQTIYTSNLIENNNKGFRQKAKPKEQFPNEDSLERFACMVYCD